MISTTFLLCLRSTRLCAPVLLGGALIGGSEAEAQVKLDAVRGSGGVSVRGQKSGVPALVRPSKTLAREVRATKEPLISDAFAAGDARGEFLNQMRRGELTPEAAWDKSLLTKENVFPIAAKWRDWSDEGKTLRIHMVGLLAQRAPEVLSPDASMGKAGSEIVVLSNVGGPSGSGVKAEGLEAWSEWKRIVAEHFKRQKDARAVVWYEAALKDWQTARSAKVQVRTVGSIVEANSQVARGKHGTVKHDGDPTWVNALGGLAMFYAETNQHVKAAQTWERAEVYSRNPAWVADTLVEAGRAYTKVGETQKAHAAYARVAQYGKGWYTGVALWDQAGRAIKEGRHEEARQFLTRPVTGPESDQIQVGLLSLLSVSHYQTREFAQAKTFGQTAVAQYKSLRKIRENSGLEKQVEKAQNIVEWSETWMKKPLVCRPSRLLIKVAKSREAGAVEKKGVENAPLYSFKIRTFKPGKLKVVSDNPWVKVRESKTPKVTTTTYYSEQKIQVELAPEALKPGFVASLKVSYVPAANPAAAIPQLTSESITVRVEVR